MTVDREKLLVALRRCLPGVETGNSLLEGADTFVFSGPAVHSYNDAISVTVSLEGVSDEDLIGVVSGIEFYNLVSQLEDTTIKLSVKPKKWSLRAGPVRVDLAQKESRVPEMIEALDLGKAKWKKLPGNFLEGLKLCLISSNRTPLAGIAISEKMMTATDGVRLSWFALKESMDQLWFSDEAAAELAKLGSLSEYSLSEAWVHFRTEDGTTFSVKRFRDTETDGKERYPFSRVSKVLSELKMADGDPKASFPKGAEDVFKRAAVFATEVDGLPVLTLTLSEKSLVCESHRTAGTFSERMKWDGPEGDPLEVAMSYAYLTGALKKTRDFYVKAKEKEAETRRYLIFYSDDYKHVVATMRGEAKEAAEEEGEE
jgi:hypothetical protein